MKRALFLFFLLALGCGDSEQVSNPSGPSAGQAGSGGSGGSDDKVVGVLCDVVAEQHPLAPTAHVTECSPLSQDLYTSNPPSSGNHYPVWAAFKAYDQPIPRGYYLHDEEHGAVVFLYNCPEGCPEDVAALKAIVAALPVDPLCTDPAGPQRRAIITPDPKIDSKFAVAAWGWTLKAPCVDPQSFSAFARAHYAKAVENFCINGTDVLAVGVAPGCGEEAK